ncbi:MAG: DUF2520 domain-containing protein [Bacteroidales bacterium]|nr:DUF2520 domain-containing protein [Bacteroidales bacterium]
MQKSITKIALAGSGNIAWHLANALKLQGYQITGIWSRNFSNARALAESCGSVACEEISDLGKSADLIIIAVADKAIEDVANAIRGFDGIVVHTAGSVSIDALKDFFKNCGVLYPLQTFSKGTPVNMREIPFFLESSSENVSQTIKQVALSLSDKVYQADSHQRILLHVAAVFAANYSNLMYTIGNEVIKSSGLPQEVLYPLILETARKAISGDPMKMQTGPARRNDTTTIEKHIEILASLPEYAELYRLLANLISKKYK